MIDSVLELNILSAAMSEFAEKIRPDLNPPQFQAVTYTGGPLLVLAGAGSGKTRVLIYKAGYLLKDKAIPPYNIMAVTFTNKAADEMKSRLFSLVGHDFSQMQVSTFHSFCVRVLRRYLEKMGRKRDFGIYDQDDSLNLVKNCMKKLNIDAKKYAPKAIVESISRAKELMIDPDEYIKTAYADFNIIVSRVYQSYQAYLIQSNAFDFDDLLFWTVKLLQKCPDVLETLQRKYQHILVDEYQDTNHVQFLLLRLLAQKSRNLTVVGDDDQSIYGWRGADIKNILEFEGSFPDCKIIKLEQNYRSTKTILKTASEIVKNNLSRKGKTLWTDGAEGDKIKLIRVNSDGEEANTVCDHIEHCLASGKFTRNQIAVLYRTNAQSRVLEESLKKRFILYTIVGGVRFYQRKEIKDILAYLKLLANPYDIVSFRRIINVPKRGIGEKSVARIEEEAVKRSISPFELLVRPEEHDFIKGAAREGAAQFRDFFMRMIEAKSMQPLHTLATTVIDNCGIKESFEEDDSIEAQSRRENIDELLAAIQDYSYKAEGATLENYLAEIALYTDIDTWDNNKDAVTLMTLHSAKGLEFPMVFITGLEEGLFPTSRSMEEDSRLEEERRLFYVGITRACRNLILTYARKRTRFGEVGAIKSRFVDELPMECIEFEDLTYSSENFTKNRRNRSHSYDDEYEIPGDKYSNLQKGVTIIHPTWGMGKIISRQGHDDSTQVDVLFKWGGRKTIFPKYANLKVVS